MSDKPPDKKSFTPDDMNRNPAGNPRPKGVPNRKSSRRISAAEKLASKIVDSPEYFKSLMDRAFAGTLPPAIEMLLWHYRFGRPVNKVEISSVGTGNGVDLTELSMDELAKRSERLTKTAMVLAAEAEAKDKPLN